MCIRDRPMSGSTLSLLHTINQYSTIAAENPESPELEGLEKKMTEMAPVIKDPKEVKTFGMVLGEVKKFAQADDTYINTCLLYTSKPRSIAVMRI